MPVRLLTGALMTALALAAGAAAPATAWADAPSTFDVAPFAAPKAPRPLFDTDHLTMRSDPRPIFDVASFAEAAQVPPVTATPNDHQFGLGIRLGGVRVGVGASLRYFFGGGPL